MGLEAVDFAAAAGLILDPWQRDVTCDIFAVDDFGLWCSFETWTIAQRQQGKGGIIETIELAALFLFGERLILHSAHEYKTAQEAFLRIKALIDGCSDLSRHVKAIREANGEQQVILRDGARLRFVARSKGSGRGFSAPRNILDEAYALTRTQLAALLPTMSAMPNPQVNGFSTVPDPETMPLEDEAVLPTVHQRAQDAVLSGDPGRMCYHDWSMQPDEDPADVDVWYRCNPALGIRIAEDYVRSELAALGPAKFSVERLGLWPKDAQEQWRVVTEDQWEASKDTESKAQDPVVFAIAVYRNEGRTQSCIGLAGSRPDGDIHIEVPQLDHRPGTGWVVERAKELNERWKPARWVVDPGSPAGSLIPDLEEAGLEVEKMTSRNVAQAFGMVYDGLTRKPGEMVELEDGTEVAVRRVWHRDDARLSTAMAAASTRRVGSDGSTWDSRETDLTPLLAVTKAVWGLLTLPPPEVVEPWVMYG